MSKKKTITRLTIAEIKKRLLLRKFGYLMGIPSDDEPARKKAEKKFLKEEGRIKDLIAKELDTPMDYRKFGNPDPTIDNWVVKNPDILNWYQNPPKIDT